MNSTTPSGNTVQKQLTKKAEILWCLDIVSNRHSFRSSDNETQLFTEMYPDSKIGKDFSCTKMMYIIVHGLAPYFKNLPLASRELDHFVLLFDE